MFAVLPALLLAAAPITVDRENHAVTLSVVSTDCGVDMQLEFLLVGPNSDRDYESMFVTEASVKDIAKAFESAGFGSPGSCHDPAKCVFWPTGQQLTMEPAFSNLVRQVRDESHPPILYTGGTRDPKDLQVPEADTNMPSAVFALYNCGQSLLQLNDNLDQSTTYGRFQPAVKIAKGEKRTITFKLGKTPKAAQVSLDFAPGFDLAKTLTSLKDQSAKGELEILSGFSPELSVKEAKDIATMLSMIDSVRVKVNGFKEGELFYRAYLPLEKWRDPKERLMQPPEVHLKTDGSVHVVETVEDWSKEDKIDPDLSFKDHACKDLAEAAQLVSRLAERTMTALVFVPPETKLGRIYEIRSGVKGNVPNWYVFTE